MKVNFIHWCEIKELQKFRDVLFSQVSKLGEALHETYSIGNRRLNGNSIHEPAVFILAL